MTDRRDWILAESSAYKRYFNDEILKEYRDGGIFNMELSSSERSFFEDTLDFLHQAKAICKRADDFGVKISSLHLPFQGLDPTESDREKREDMVAFQSAMIAAAGDAGIKTVVVHPSCEPYTPEEREERIKYSIETLNRYQRVAKDAGTRLAVENLPRTCLCNTSCEMLQILGAVDGAYACFDTNHSTMEDNISFIKALGNRIITLHISDYDFIDERHLMPLEGKNSWKEIIRALEEIDYQGYFTYEVSATNKWTKNVWSIKDFRENFEKLMAL